MEWIDAKKNPPEMYQEIIICSDERRVKPAIYLGNGKYNTYLNVVYWQPLPEAPKVGADKCVETVKKRGRPKKNG